MQIPSNWHAKSVPLIWHDTPNSLDIIEVQKHNGYGLRIEHKVQEYMHIEEISSQHVLDIYESSRNTANITRVEVDSVSNSILVDYFTKHASNKEKEYYRNYFVIKNKLWITVDFHGPNSAGFRDTVSIITSSVKLY